jgi:hypothetical protein
VELKCGGRTIFPPVIKPRNTVPRAGVLYVTVQKISISEQGNFIFRVLLSCFYSVFLQGPEETPPQACK